MGNDAIKVLVRLPPEAVSAVLDSRSWRGSVSVDRFRTTTRAFAIREQLVAKTRYRDASRATIEERKVIRAWNRSKYIANLEKASYRESRNLKLPFNKINENLPLIKQALREVSLVEIERSMEAYFEFCSKGEHIYDGRSHGFKTLTGFLLKLIELHKSKQRGWWDIRESATQITNAQDPNARLTKRIADSFARTFLEQDHFDLENNAKAHSHFQKTAHEIVKYIARQKRRRGIELTQKTMIENLLFCVSDLFDDGSAVHPGHLSCAAMWTDILPQYLKAQNLV